MLTLLTALAFLLFGRELVARSWSRDEMQSMERASAALTFGLALWLLSIWSLAFVGWLARPFIVAVTIIILIAAMVSWFTRSRAMTRPHAAFWIAAIPIAVWCAFILWRGWIAPPLSHDAVAYHLPKALLYAKAERFQYFEFLEYHIRKLPANYELLLAEILSLEGSDRITEWPSALLYVAIVILGAAFAQRWWKSSAFATAITALVIAGIPVLLLHSGAHKNDLLTATFMLAMLLFGGRWIGTGDARALVPLILATGAAIGTKPQAGVLALALLPFALWRLRRSPLSWRWMLSLLALGIAAILMLGGWVYLDNHRHPDAPGAAGEIVQYGDWSNLWQGPYVLLAAPFTLATSHLPVPWSAEPWFWPKHEIYFSHLGAPFALCALLAPFVLVKLRRRTEGPALERIVVPAAALTTFVIMLPVRFEPHGLYAISLPRYALYLAPVVIAAVIPPLAMAAQKRFAKPVVVLAIAAFAIHAFDAASNDAFAPLSYVLWLRDHPTRQIPFDLDRAANVVDCVAGPREKIAVDAGFTAWLLPLYGEDLQRPVEFIPDEPGPPRIDGDVRWVVVDRGWKAIWGHADLRDLSQARRLIASGATDPADRRVFDALRRDPRFVLVFYNSRTNQALFERVR